MARRKGALCPRVKPVLMSLANQETEKGHSMFVNRNPFAREELHKSREYTYGTCAWCGSHCETPKGKRFLYRFRVESDGGRKSEDSRLFCSKPCRDDYHS